jgi:hypothetical protein
MVEEKLNDVALKTEVNVRVRYCDTMYINLYLSDNRARSSVVVEALTISLKVADSIPNDITEFLQFTQSFQLH